MKYLIHSCPKRYWYVKDYLVPSMIMQGIPISDIKVYNDEDKLGNLRACMKTFSEMPDDDYGTWHLQDDVVISKFFFERTYEYDDGLVCGYCSSYSIGKPPGVVTPTEMWYSFPCIRIPNVIARECAKWFYQGASKDKRFERYVQENKFDDEFFKVFIREKYPTLRLRNLSPNLVDHVDWMIGGSTINSRKEARRSLFWNEEDVINRLQYQLTH